MKYFILVFGLFLVSCGETEKFVEVEQPKQTVVTLGEHERFIDAKFAESRMWIMTQDTITKIFYLRGSGMYNRMEWKIEIR